MVMQSRHQRHSNDEDNSILKLCVSCVPTRLRDDDDYDDLDDDFDYDHHYNYDDDDDDYFYDDNSILCVCCVPTRLRYDGNNVDGEYFCPRGTPK